MKKTWQGTKQVINMNNKVSPQITQLNYKEKQIDTNGDMANTFNDFFTNIGPILDNEIPVYHSPRFPHAFQNSPTNAQETSNLINSLDDTKSCGPCPAPTKMLKFVSREISIPLSNICYTSFDEGVFSDKIKL